MTGSPFCGGGGISSKDLSGQIHSSDSRSVVWVEGIPLNLNRNLNPNLSSYRSGAPMVHAMRERDRPSLCGRLM